jgi:hypothetical protein
VTYWLPETLKTEDDTTALTYLRQYYGSDGTSAYTGSFFDDWGGNDEYCFTADDLVAVSFLSVFVPPLAARELLARQADRFAALLRDAGPDRDLVNEETALGAEWPVRTLYAALRELRGVGPTIASKLCARKRPRLVPVYDTVVARVTDGTKAQWEPLRLRLREREGALHTRLLALREKAGLGDHVSALRVYDVVTWMEGKDKDYVGTTEEEQLGWALASPPVEPDEAPDEDPVP